MIELRASELADFISDPLNYFKNAVKEDVKTPAMVNGIEREVLSYSMYDNIAKNKDYKKQLALEYTTSDFKITGHPDIVDGDMVVDIKNSQRSDEELIKAYWYQLNAYALMCNTNQAWLFVDNNAGQEVDMELTRLIQVPVDTKKFLDDVNNAVNLIKSVGYLIRDKITPKSELGTLINKLAKLQEQQAKLDEEVANVKTELQQGMKDYYSVLCGNYVVSRTYRKDVKRKLKTISETWNGEYKEIITFKEVKK